MKELRYNLSNYGSKGRRIILGRQGNDGLLFKTVIYALLISIGFVYLYPMLYMLSQSMKSLSDLLNPSVIWIPTGIHLQNFIMSWKVLNYGQSLLDTLYVSVLPAIAQALSTAIVGYGFARFEFPGKKLLFLLMIFTFIIPVQVSMIPLFVMFNKYSMLGSPLPFLIPSLFASGLKSTLFILIYSQFFRSVPDSLEEAAQIDGAGYLKTFFRIVFPISVPAIVVVFLFAFVWQWNETYMSSLYYGNSLTTLPLQLKSFADSFALLYPVTQTANGTTNINEAIEMAGTLLTILPLLLLYFVAQRWFVEVVDRAGITGE